MKTEPRRTKAGDRHDGAQMRCVAFEGHRRIASGELLKVARKTKEVIDRGERGPIVIFDEVTSQPVEVDFRGTTEQVLERIRRTSAARVAASEVPEKQGPGRPKLGVVSREVTLLPRHWEWLNGCPNGASAALRRLVEEARRSGRWKDRARQSQEAAYRFMSVMAGNLPGFEEALRAFYARNYRRFEGEIEPWPKDIRDHVKKLVAVAIQDEAAALEKE